ncbi:MAG: metalloregulator ArsR/SmtB family transcription factor [Leptospiraceae bacterium]|nr:metalloregulator ArsR/SmtB family transcription factor [Leptospiraceae bacterium]MDW8307054.1 metalloregulator ArsR/SmtB family transcription factor [Leptospiraceae bacterium]
MAERDLPRADKPQPERKDRQRPVRKTVDRQDIHLFRTQVLRALSDETRQGIIILLGRQGALFVNDIAAYFNVSRPTVSHHLRVLREARIVRAEKRGKEIYYSLNQRFLLRSIKNLLRLVESIEPKEKE